MQPTQKTARLISNVIPSNVREKLITMINQAGWYDNNWRHRISIKVAKEKISGSEPLINFPLFFVLAKKQLSENAQKNGNDFLFTAADGKTKLSHDIQSWDPYEGKLVAYIKIPALSPQKDNIFYLYYGNPNCSNQESKSDVWSDYLYRQNFRKDPLAHINRKDNELIDDEGTPLIKKLLLAQKCILENLFGQKWFTTNKRKIQKHPAYKRWNLCNTLLSNNCIFKFPRDEQSLPEFALIFIENLAFIQCSKGNINTFQLGNIANYGGPEVQKRLRSEIFHHKKYLALQTELQFAAWHLSRSHKVEAYEREGADFKIEMDGWNLPIICDCKKIGQETSLSRIRYVIKKANKQIKSHGMDCYGLITVDLTDKILVKENLSDTIPQEIIDFRNEAIKSLKKYNSSITAALLMWQEINILKPPPDSKGNVIMVVLRTISEIILHSNPINSFSREFDLNELKIGNTISFIIRTDNQRINSDK